MPKFNGRAASRAPHIKLLGQRVRGDATVKPRPAASRTGGRTPGRAPGRAPEERVSTLKDIIKGKLSTRQRMAATLSKKEKRRAFNLDDDDDDDDLQEETLMLKGGKSIFEVSRKDIAAVLDDMDDKGLQLSDDEQHERQLDASLTGEILFGQGQGDDDEEGSATRKRLNRKERLAELIKSSKQQRLANSELRHHQASLLESANNAVESVLQDLDFRPAKNTPAYTAYMKEQQDLEEIRDSRTAQEKNRDDDFDRLTRELAIQPTGQASDRVKSLFERTIEKTRSMQLEEERKAAEMAKAAKLLRAENDDLLHGSDNDSESDSESESDSASDVDIGTKHASSSRDAGSESDSTGGSDDDGPFSEYGTDSDIDSEGSG